MCCVIRAILLVCLTTRLAEGFGTGAPFKTCIDSFPKHHGTADQTGYSPYQVTLDKTSYSPGDTIRVTLGSEGGDVFRGFQVRAQRTTGDQEDIVGDFIDVPHDARLQFWYPEADGQHNCVTHRNSTDKTEIVLLWKAPDKSYGDLEFRSGFVMDFATFWPDVRSSVLKASVPAEVVGTDEAVTSVMPDLSVDTECGVTKGCLLYPSTCTGDNCRFGVAYSPTDDGQHVQFEMFGNVEPGDYLSVGLSHDKMMGHDKAMSCFMDADLARIGFINGYCPHQYCDRVPVDGISELAIKREDGRLYCTFVQPINMTNHAYNQNYATGELTKVYPVSFDLNDDYYIFIAWGPRPGGMEVVGKHHQLPLVSNEKINLMSTRVSSGHQLPLELQIHATLGLVSWLGLVGLGMFTARHYRQDITKPCCGVPSWFQLHRAVMVLSVLCSVAGVILIFVYLKAWTEHATLHAIFGLVAVGLSLVQTLAGMLRPGLDSSYRPVFNWAHRLTAVLAFASAAVCLFMGAQNTLFHPTLRQIETIIIAVGLFFQVFWEVIMEFKAMKKAHTNDNKQEEKDNFDNKKASGMEMEEHEPDVSFNTNMFIYACFVVTTLVTTALCIVFIFELL